MSLAKKWKESPVISLIVVCIAIGSGIYGITEFLNAQQTAQLTHKYETKISQLHSQLASINLQVSGAQGLDIKNLLVRTGDSSAIPVGSKFFQQNSFYALNSTDYWRHQSITEAQMYAQSGVEFTDDLMDRAKQVRVDQWTAGTPQTLMIGAEQIQLQPNIFVQRIDQRQIATSVGVEETRQVDAKPSGLRSAFQNASHRANTARKNSVVNSLLQDPAGKYFCIISTERIQNSLQSGQTSYLLNKIQKDSNTLFAQSSMVFHDVMIDGRHVPKYYLHFEEIYIESQGQLYLIRFTIPTEQPVVDQKTRAENVRWLEKFRIVQQPAG